MQEMRMTKWSSLWHKNKNKQLTSYDAESVVLCHDISYMDAGETASKKAQQFPLYCHADFVHHAIQSVQSSDSEK